jgi:hypothetical protein
VRITDPATTQQPCQIKVSDGTNDRIETLWTVLANDVTWSCELRFYGESHV